MSVSPADVPAQESPEVAAEENKRSTRIHVSNTKKPLFFYVNLAKKFLQQYEQVELSALGMAIGTAVTVSEILKNNGLAYEKKISTSTVDMSAESKLRGVQKPKFVVHMEIILLKSEQFDELMAAAAEARELAPPETDQPLQ